MGNSTKWRRYFYGKFNQIKQIFLIVSFWLNEIQLYFTFTIKLKLNLEQLKFIFQSSEVEHYRYVAVKNWNKKKKHNSSIFTRSIGTDRPKQMW